MKDHEAIRLCELQNGQSAVIEKILEPIEDHPDLAAMGIYTGLHFTKSDIQPLDGGVEIEAGGKKLALYCTFGENIIVRPDAFKY